MRCSHLDGHRRRPRINCLCCSSWSCFRCGCFECRHPPRVPTLGKSPFSLHEGFWCRRSTALSSSWVSNLGESIVKETNRSFDRSKSKFEDPRCRPRGRITKPVKVTTAYTRTILSGTAASAPHKMAKAALHLKDRLYVSREGHSTGRAWGLAAVNVAILNHERSPGLSLLKGHLRALPTEIISPAKWRSNRKWRPTNGPADRLATKFPKISSFWWVLQWAAATTGPGNMSLRASAPSTGNIVRSRFFVFSEVDGWLAAKVDQ